MLQRSMQKIVYDPVPRGAIRWIATFSLGILRTVIGYGESTFDHEFITKVVDASRSERATRL